MDTKETNAVRDVDDYLSRLPKECRSPLERLRKIIRSIIPEATEVISYQVPTFKHNGRMLVSYAGFQKHCSFFPGAGPIEAHQKELRPFSTSKGTIRFTPEQPLPAVLVKKLVKTRIRLNQEALQKRTGKKRSHKRR